MYISWCFEVGIFLTTKVLVANFMCTIIMDTAVLPMECAKNYDQHHKEKKRHYNSTTNNTSHYFSH